MNETFVTLSGWLGGDVTHARGGRRAGGQLPGGQHAASLPAPTDSWEDGDTQWYAVNAWRALAENCDRSLRRGDPVVVHGKLSAHVWTNKAGPRGDHVRGRGGVRRPRPQPRHQQRSSDASAGRAGRGAATPRGRAATTEEATVQAA